MNLRACNVIQADSLPVCPCLLQQTTDVELFPAEFFFRRIPEYSPSKGQLDFSIALYRHREAPGTGAKYLPPPNRLFAGVGHTAHEAKYEMSTSYGIK